MDRWRSWNSQKLPGRAVCRHVRGWLGRQSNALAAIEVHRTACIVTHPPAGELASEALVQPCKREAGRHAVLAAAVLDQAPR